MRKYTAILICFLFVSALHAADTLTFAQAANLAVAYSADLKHSRASQKLLEGAWKLGRRAYLPQLNITISENDRLQQLGEDSFVKNYGVNVDQLLFDGGRLLISRKMERMELDLSSVKLDRMTNETAEAAIAAYRNVLSSRAILKIKKSALAVLEEQLKILNEEVSLGLALPIDLASADISLAGVKLDINSLAIDLAEMEKQFAELLGLEVLPVLIEKVDIYRSIKLPDIPAASDLAKKQNPGLNEARHSKKKKKMELKYVSKAWIPTLKFNGNYAITGRQYPLTKHNWSVGISVDFTHPWFQNRFVMQTGWEPVASELYDRSAILQNSFTPIPDPAAGLNKKQAALTLAFEQENYNTLLERLERITSNVLEKCVLAEQKRLLSLESASLGIERCHIEEIRLGLGQITRLDLMEVLLEQTQKEIAVIEAAIALLEAERELERFLDLRPGELEVFVINNSKQILP
jgi:outer membrane protein TolC